MVQTNIPWVIYLFSHIILAISPGGNKWQLSAQKLKELVQVDTVVSDC